VLLSGELLTWLQLGGDAMRMVTSMSLKTKEILDDFTSMGRLATIKANNSLSLDLRRLTSGPGASGKGSVKESAEGDEMLFGDDRLLSMLLGCACFFPTRPPRVHADSEPSRDANGERGKHLGSTGRWSKSTSLMRAKGMMRPTWLAARNPYGASSSLHLVRPPYNKAYPNWVFSELSAVNERVETTSSLKRSRSGRRRRRYRVCSVGSRTLMTQRRTWGPTASTPSFSRRHPMESECARVLPTQTYLVDASSYPVPSALS